MDNYYEKNIYLIVGGNVLWRAPVNDSTNRGFVDAHAEGDSGNDDRYFSVHEIFLDRTALAILQTGMVGFAR
jgi:hypothetical protein